VAAAEVAAAEVAAAEVAAADVAAGATAAALAAAGAAAEVELEAVEPLLEDPHPANVNAAHKLKPAITTGVRRIRFALNIC